MKALKILILASLLAWTGLIALVISIASLSFTNLPMAAAAFGVTMLCWAALYLFGKGHSKSQRDVP